MKRKTISLYDIKAIVAGNNQKLLVVTKDKVRPFMQMEGKTYEAESSLDFDQENAVVFFDVKE